MHIYLYIIFVLFPLSIDILLSFISFLFGKEGCLFLAFLRCLHLVGIWDFFLLDCRIRQIKTHTCLHRREHACTHLALPSLPRAPDQTGAVAPDRQADTLLSWQAAGRWSFPM